eukprot:186537_1
MMKIMENSIAKKKRKAIPARIMMGHSFGFYEMSPTHPVQSVMLRHIEKHQLWHNSGDIQWEAMRILHCALEISFNFFQVTFHNAVLTNRYDVGIEIGSIRFANCNISSDDSKGIIQI